MKIIWNSGTYTPYAKTYGIKLGRYVIALTILRPMVAPYNPFAKDSEQ